MPRWAAIAAIAGAGVFAAVDAVLEHSVGYPWYLSIPDALVGFAYITGGVVAFRAAYATAGVVAFRARRLDRTGTLMTAIGVITNLDSVALYVHALLPYAAWVGNLTVPLLRSCCCRTRAGWCAAGWSGPCWPPRTCRSWSSTACAKCS